MISLTVILLSLFVPADERALHYLVILLISPQAIQSMSFIITTCPAKGVGKILIAIKKNLLTKLIQVIEKDHSTKTG